MSKLGFLKFLRRGEALLGYVSGTLGVLIVVVGNSASGYLLCALCPTFLAIAYTRAKGTS